MRVQIKTSLFKSLIENWEAFPKDNQGALATIIDKLELAVFPKGEYIIRAGELADEMYFIVSGYCKVVTEDGHELAVLKHG